MKKIIAILLCALLLCGMTACNSAEEGPGAVLGAQDITLTMGETGTLSVKLENVSNLKKYGNGTLGGFQFKVIYDPAVIDLGNATLTTDSIATEENNWTLDFSDKEDGSAMVMILDDNLNGTTATTVPMIDLMVQAVEGASGETQVKFEIVNICDSRGDAEVRETISDGTATVTIG